MFTLRWKCLDIFGAIIIHKQIVCYRGYGNQKKKNIDEIPKHLMDTFLDLLFDRNMFTEIIVYYHLFTAIVRPSSHMVIIVNKKFTSNRSGRTHYGNDGSMPSILSVFTVVDIAYFALPRTHPRRISIE